MAGKRSKGKKKTLIDILIIAVVVVVIAAITFSGKLGLSDIIPTWDDLYSDAGIDNDSSDIVGDGSLKVHYIDVGQGDSILISCDDKNVLIDGGDTDAADAILGYLKKQEVTKLDYVIATHPHADHIGSLDDVINEFETENIIMPKIKDSKVPTTKVYERLLDAIDNNNVNVIEAKPGDSYNIGSGVMEILAPVDDYDDLNNYSVVSRFIYGDTSFLFTGDAEKQAENDILSFGEDVKADVLKLGHHGSSTSTGENWLEAVDPKICIMSLGEGNDYGHPHKETLQAMKDYNLEYFRTDINGNIVIVSDGKNISVTTDKE